MSARTNTIRDVIERREVKLAGTQKLLEELAGLPRDSFQRIDSTIMALMQAQGYTPIFHPNAEENQLKEFMVSAGSHFPWTNEKSPLKPAYDLAERAYRLANKFLKITQDPDLDPRIDPMSIVPFFEAMGCVDPAKGRQLMGNISLSMSAIEDLDPNLFTLVEHFMTHITPSIQAEFSSRYQSLAQMNQNRAIYWKHRAVLNEAYGGVIAHFAEHITKIATQKLEPQTEAKGQPQTNIKSNGFELAELDRGWETMKGEMGKLSATVELHGHSPLASMDYNRFEKTYGIPMGIRWGGKREAQYGKISIVVSPNGADIRDLSSKINKKYLADVYPLLDQIGKVVTSITVQPYAGLKEGTSSALTAIFNLK